MEYFLGLDVGTSGCKAVAFAAEDGAQAAHFHREYDLQVPHEGWAELESGEVMESCLTVIRQCAAALDGPIRGLGISSQGEAITPVAADGRYLANGMVSSDQRAIDYVQSFPAAFGEERLYRLTGHTAHPMFSLFKLLWLRDHQPEVWSRSASFLCYEDLLHHRLGLSPAIGWPLAGRTMLFDVTRHEWSEEILDAVGLSPDKLARPLASGSRVGEIPAAVAGALGLPKGVVVVTGGHDQPCGALGAGAIEPGLSMYATGTVECMCPAFDHASFTDDLRRANLCTYDHTVPGMYTTVAFSLTGGNILKWFRDQFGQAEMAAARANGSNVYELLLAQLEDRPTSLLALPYFTTSGTPHFDSNVPGALLGLRLSSSRAEILRALLEGVVFEMRLNLEILERSGGGIRELRLIGGGSQSQLWNQLKADVLGVPLTRLDVTEAGCLGVAMLACSAVTGEPLGSLASRWIRPLGTIQPREERRDWYNRRFAAYRQLYPTLKQLAFTGGESG